MGSGAGISAILSTTASLDFPSVAAGGTQSLTATIAGAVAGNNVIVNADMGATDGLIFQAYVSAADTVTVKVTNVTGAAIDPASLSFRITVVKF